MEEDDESKNASVPSAVGVLLACLVVGIGAMRGVPVSSLIVRGAVIGTVATLCVRIMQTLLQPSSNEGNE